MAPKEKTSPTQAATPSKKQKGEQKASGGKGAKGKKQLMKPTITDVLLADHRETMTLLRLFQKEMALPKPNARKLEMLVDGISVVIRLHSQAEMDVLYPMLDSKVGSGKSKHSLEEHSKIETNLLKALELRKSGGEELNGLINEVATAFEAHLHEEEDELMPQLLEKMGDEGDQQDMAQHFMSAKERAPLEPAPEQVHGEQAAKGATKGKAEEAVAEEAEA